MTSKPSHMPSVDVVVPCYNYARYLHQCLDSILSQSPGDMRVLIIDDASSDDSASVAREIAATDPRVSVLVHERNRGHIATNNEDLDWAQGDYLMLLSAHHVLAPGSLQRAATSWTDTPKQHSWTATASSSKMRNACPHRPPRHAPRPAHRHPRPLQPPRQRRLPPHPPLDPLPNHLQTQQGGEEG